MGEEEEEEEKQEEMEDDEQRTLNEEEGKLSQNISDDTCKDLENSYNEGLSEDSSNNEPEDFSSYSHQSIIEGLAEDMLEDMPEDLPENEDEDDEDMEPVLPAELGEVWELRDEKEIMKRLDQYDQSGCEDLDKIDNEDYDKENSENEDMEESENEDGEPDIKEDKSEKRFYCDICPTTTKYQISLKKHKEKHHNNLKKEASKEEHSEEKFKCFVDQCLYKSRFNSNLSRHIKVMHEGVKIPKRTRRKKLCAVDNLGSRLSCNKCDFTSKFANRFNNHVLEKHTDLLTSRRGRSQPQRKDSKEIKFEDEKYFCDQCEFSTTEVSLIQKHRVGSHGSRQENLAETNTKVEAGVTSMNEKVTEVKEEVYESITETLSESTNKSNPTLASIKDVNTSWSQFLLGSINPDLPPPSASAPPPAPASSPPAPQSPKCDQDVMKLMSNSVQVSSIMLNQPKMKSCHQVQRKKQKFKDELKKPIGEDTTHLSLVSGKGVCPTCGGTKVNVRAHYMSVHIKGEFPCLMCDHVTTSSMKLSDHKYRKHPETRKVNRNHDNAAFAL